MLVLVSVAVFAATLIGGFFALYLKDRLHLILGFSGGAVIAVAFFDILPEALELTGATYSPSTILAITVLGFALYLMLYRFVLRHGHAVEENHSIRGNAGAGSISFHSFLDGIAIGLAFQVSIAVGTVVAVAVLAHNFSDGINTVNMILRHQGERNHALKWLFVDALAPVAGIISTLFFTVPAEQLGLLLALFAGFFLYIGASDLIPESYHGHPVRWTTIMTLIGIGVLYIIIKLAGI